MVTQAEFYATKRKEAEFHCLTFDHPDFDAPIRLVFNQFADVTLNCNTYTATVGTVDTSTMEGETPSISITFPRIVVGRDFKKQLKKITDSGRMSPISGTYEKFIPSVQLAPVRQRTLHVVENSGIAMNGSSVTVKLGEVNRLTKDVADLYDISIFTGLETV